MKWFVLGNGYSLNVTPLEKIKGFNSIGMNGIHKFYDRTTWRPSVYVNIDHNVYVDWKYRCKLHLDMGIPCYLWSALKDGHPDGHPNHDILPDGIGNYPNAVWVDRCEHTIYRYPNPKAAQEWHLPRICTGFSKISAAIQIAYLRGATEIFLLGCDLGITESNNHMVEDYLPEKCHAQEYTTKQELNMLAAHLLAKKSCPVPIYNCTVGGKLEVYPRMELKDAVRNN